MSTDSEKYEGLDWEKMHWIGPSLGEKYERLMGYDIWTYETLLEARRFFSQYKVHPFFEDHIADNWIDYGHELEIKIKDGLDKPLLSYTKEQINQLLSDPEFTGDIKANFSYAFWRNAETLPALIRAELQAFKKVEREPFDFISPKFFTAWVRGGNNGLIVSRSGQNGSGKTSYGLTQTEMVLNEIENAVAATNVIVVTESEEIKKRIRRFRTIGEWLLTLFDNKIAGNHSFSDIDELTYSNIRKKTTMHGVTLSIDRVDKGTRKLDDDNLFQWHFISEVPNEILTKSQFKVTKYGSTTTPQQRHMADIDYNYGEGQKRKYVSGIPDTNLKFKTGRFSWFILDVDVDALFFQFAKMQDDMDDDIEAYSKMRDMVQEAIEKNQEYELEPDRFLPIKEAARRIQETQSAIMKSNKFIKQDRYSEGIFVRPAFGYGWDGKLLSEGEQQEEFPEGNEPQRMEEIADA